MQVRILENNGELLSSPLEIGVRISTVPDCRRMLDMILREARKFTRAEAGLHPGF